MRPSTAALLVIGTLSAAAAGIFTVAAQSTAAHAPRLEATRDLVERLGLTDLALFTEARYTRHPTQADLHSALQDHPGGFDHFPSGSLLPPPASLTRPHAPLAGKTTSPD
jgi:hypothetical protein